MKKPLFVVFAAVIGVVCLICGCGGGSKTESKSSETQKSATTSVVYKASLEGFDVSLNLPASSDPTTKAIDSYVSRVAKVSGKSAEPYVIASYSVKNGSSEPTIMVDFNFSLTLSDGKKIDGQFAQLFIGDQQEKLEAPFDTGFYNEGVDLISNLIDMDTTDIAPGASGTAYCVFHTGDLTGIKKVSVSKSGTSKEMTSQ